MMKKDWFFFGAIIFFFWSIINTWFGVARYGIEQGMYMWFCNLALFAIAYGLWKKNTSWLIAWLSFALFTQSFWIIDNIWRITTKKNLFGLVEFMYQPGYPLDEFLVSHYHYFIIPTITIALFFIKQKKSYAKNIAIIHSTLIFLVSYFFPYEQNINCIHESCFDSLQLKGVQYSILFALSLLIVGTIITHYLEKLHKSIKITKKQQKIVIYFFIMILIFSVVLVIVDISYKKTLPHFVCLYPFENSEVKISCKYITEFKDEQMWLVYTITNKLNVPRVCFSKININGNEMTMHQNLYLGSYKKSNIGFVLPYPKDDATAKLSANCTSPKILYRPS